MSYLTTVQQVRAAANAVNGNRFDHGRRVDFSQNFSNPFPYIWLYPVDISDAPVGEFIDSTTILLGFWDQDRPETSVQEREAIIGKMDALATAFLDELRENTLLQVSNVTREPQYQHSQGHVSGMAVRFTLQNFSPCP